MRIGHSVFVKDQRFKCPAEAVQKAFEQLDIVFRQLALALTAPRTFPNRDI
jgi:hypothetical protein